MKLWLSKESLSHNLLIVGASGSMKTSCMVGLADQAISQGLPCIFTDVKARADKPSYTSHYYRPDKDHLFNLADARGVKWQLHREFRDPLGALMLSRRIVKEGPQTIPFFINNTRDIMSHSFGDLGLTVKELLHAVNYPSRPSTGLYARLEHGPYGELFKQSSETRTGILGNLKYALSSFALLPDEGREFSAYDWASHRGKDKGHIFLASSRNNWEAQKDLQSLLLDLLFLNIQTYPDLGMMFLDEMGIFKSEEIEPALSVQRDAGVPIVLAFQNFSQLNENYGQDRKRSILSNPGTKLILRVDGKEAEEAQDLISAGVEVERFRESRSAKWWKPDQHHTYSTERPTIKPVPAGVIQTLKPGKGFLVQPGRITPVQLRYRGLRQNQPGFVPRIWPAYVPPPPEAKKPEPAATPKSRYTKAKPEQFALPE